MENTSSIFLFHHFSESFYFGCALRCVVFAKGTMVFAAAHVVKGWTTELGLFGGAQWSTAANEGMFVSSTTLNLAFLGQVEALRFAGKQRCWFWGAYISWI